jgi:spore maturation protein SpmA
VRIAIVEDHPAERELIATMCAEYFNGRNVGATAGRNAMQTVCDVFPDAKSAVTTCCCSTVISATRICRMPPPDWT